MQFMDFLHLFSADPAASAKTGLRFVHFLALAIGLGGATLLDLMLLRFCVRRKVSEDTYSVFEFATKIVDFGLKLLWITGVGFLFHYALLKPELLGNPKVHAKLVMVGILTLNGMFIHTVILPHLRNQIGKSLFSGVSSLRRSIFLISGAISVVSWYTPVALGAFSQLNFSVPATTLLTIYFLMIAAAGMVMHLLVSILENRPEPDPGATRPDVVYAGDEFHSARSRLSFLPLPVEGGKNGLPATVRRGKKISG